jgi:hypothetical protein
MVRTKKWLLWRLEQGWLEIYDTPMRGFVFARRYARGLIIQMVKARVRVCGSWDYDTTARREAELRESAACRLYRYALDASRKIV